MYVLGIETSCDETSCAIVKNRMIISNATISSLRFHRKYGGIIPEIATRNHVKVIDKVLSLAVSRSGIDLKKLSLIGVTYRPGLKGALMVGLNFAKALSLALDKPFAAIDHLRSHLFAPFLDNNLRIPFPFLGLVVSGGHTELILVKDFNKTKVLGETRDDAAGEVF
ncbi:MAG: tRNA (adenosine(37)-N6)-threonylcarbamoyltransferase complex transferase subunit TsaD, partial [Candidatus Omnitrophota bacterium]